MLEVILGIQVILIVLVVLRLRVVLYTNREQKKYIDEMENVLINTTQKIDNTYKEILIIDHMGIFENNDHTGIMFNTLKQSYDELYKYLRDEDYEQTSSAPEEEIQ